LAAESVAKPTPGLKAANRTVREALGRTARNSEGLAAFLLGDEGPHWYRGLVPGAARRDAGDADIARALKAFGVQAIVIGHTTHEQLAALHGGRVYAIDAGFKEGLPGEAWIRGKGFSYDASTREEYEKILEQIDSLPRLSPALVERARLYAHHFFFRRSIPVPLELGDPARDTANVALSSLDELRPGADPPAGWDRGQETDLVESVVDRHLGVLDAEVVHGQLRDHRQRQEPVSNRCAVRAFGLGAIDVDVNPLVILGDVGEHRRPDTNDRRRDGLREGVHDRRRVSLRQSL